METFFPLIFPVISLPWTNDYLLQSNYGMERRGKVQEGTGGESIVKNISKRKSRGSG